MGIKIYNSDGTYTKEFKALEKKVMDANPSIYGDGKTGGRSKQVGGTGRRNTILYDGDKIYLPKYSIKTGKTEKVLVDTKMKPTGKYEYVSKNPPTWTKTTTITKVPLQEEPKPEPTPGPQGPPGKDGVGIKDVDLKDGKLIFLMTDGTTQEVDASSIMGKDGKDGVGVEDIKVDGDKMIFIMSDGTEKEVPVAGLQGADGKDGVGIDKIEVKDGKIVFIMTDGSEQTIDASAFKGEDGESAYELAVKHGFTGTEEEWLESLKGETIEKTWVDGEILKIETSTGRIIEVGDVVKTELEQAIEEGIVPEGTTFMQWIEFKTPRAKVDPADGNVYVWQFGDWAKDESGNRIRIDGEDGEILYTPEQAQEQQPREE